MSAAWRYICPVCGREGLNPGAIREHAANTTDDPEAHAIVAKLEESALQNPSFGLKWGHQIWQPGTSQFEALKPLRNFLSERRVHR